MNTVQGEPMQSINLNGVTYVRSQEDEIRGIKQIHEAEKAALREEILKLRKEAENAKREIEFKEAETAFFKRGVNFEDASAEKVSYDVKLNFIDPPFRGQKGHSSEFEQTFREIGEAIRFIDKKVYEEIDKHSTHTYDYCAVKIKCYYVEQYKSMDVDFPVSALSMEFNVDSDVSVKKRDWAKIIQDRGYDRDKNS